MTIIFGKIEPIKRLKETLHSRGIYQFSSIRDVNSFIKQYDSIKQSIPETTKNSFDYQIEDVKLALDNAIKLREKNILTKFFYYYRTRKLRRNHAVLIKNYNFILSEKTSESYKNLEFIKETVDGLYSTIAGAIGENAVVRELKKLSDQYYLINDFSLKFNPPIYNKRENDRIYSIQIDHLLVCPSGIFILETKNWSSKSVENIDLRSPVEQIKRASFALFVYLNSNKKKGLLSNHWGSKKIPIKNIIVMTNKSPVNDFHHVKVLSLSELNHYIQYFEEIFDDAETEVIFTYLNNKISSNT
jgi:hypothetical protein